MKSMRVFLLIVDDAVFLFVKVCEALTALLASINLVPGLAFVRSRRPLPEQNSQVANSLLPTHHYPLNTTTTTHYNFKYPSYNLQHTHNQ